MAPRPEPITVVLADDNTNLTSALSKVFELGSDIVCVGCVAHAQKVLEEVSRCQPRVLVIDLSLPGGDSASIIRELQSVAPSVRAIVYSGYQDDERIDRTMDAGAWQFVCKDCGIHELLDAIRSVASNPMIAPARRLASDR